MSKQQGVEVFAPTGAVKTLKDLPLPAEVITEMRQVGQRTIARATAVSKRAADKSKVLFADAKETGMQALTEVQKASLRSGQVVKSWWKGLPNDGVRAGIIGGAVFVMGLIPALIILRRRGAP